MLQRALISVSDKTNIVDFAKQLASLGVEILSTGGTAKTLADAGIKVTEVSDYTGFPEIMAGRVKTLHPKVHGGILARRGTDEPVMREHGIQPIDLVVVNLYPFQKQNSIENIDIGGPTMVRAAAKNYADVVIAVDPFDYDKIIKELKAEKQINKQMRLELAAKAFAHTAQYDAAISNYFAAQTKAEEGLPETVSIQLKRVQNLRYGENPHQAAGLYKVNGQAFGFTHMQQHQGKPLSYNNLADANAAVACIREFPEQAACVIVKHANPCGVAVADTLAEAYRKAFACDTTSAFGGIIALNQKLDAKTAETIVAEQFVELIIAPDVADEALRILVARPNVRVLSYDLSKQTQQLQMHCIDGGVLLQEPDAQMATKDSLRVVSKAQADEQVLHDLLFAMRVVKHVKSNAIVYAKNGQTLGIGPGQTARVTSSEVGIIKAGAAGLTLKDAVMASDAFFPFRDSIDAAAKTGIKAIIQPGGSKRDEEVIQAADEHGIIMVFTGMRHFKH
jgi:phosphoribosylaminoimidazolecarboxamide formyltransferase/IMP cyclohydrolase